MSDDPMEVDGMQDGDLMLLNRTTAIMEAEISLTKVLEKVEPWLKGAKVNPNQPRVRPIPSTMDEAKAILAIARNLSNRTSAPAGWNPAAPITNFATPNPLPNQLRGGALAALQLERAKQVESDKRRIIEEETEAEKNKKAKKEERTTTNQPQQAQPNPQHRRSAPPQPAQKPKPVVSMNLSDSESSDDDDDDDD